MYVIVDWNAKVGKQNTAGVTGSFGLGIRNKRGGTMIDFCSRNSLAVMLQCSNNMQEDYILGSHRITLLKTRLIISYVQVDGKSL